MIEKVMKHINNYFVVDSHDVELNVVDGSAYLPFLQEGQFYKIAGSVFNDGVYQYGEGGLTDETPIAVTVYSLAPPKAFLDVVDEISAYSQKEQNADTTGYTSESFGGYSYTKGTGANGAPIGWKEVFASKLNDWRKL